MGSISGLPSMIQVLSVAFCCASDPQRATWVMTISPHDSLFSKEILYETLSFNGASFGCTHFLDDQPDPSIQPLAGRHRQLCGSPLHPALYRRAGPPLLLPDRLGLFFRP